MAGATTWMLRTIVRTVQALGYERFADFAADLRKHFVTQNHALHGAAAAMREKRSVPDHVRQAWKRDTENLSVLRSSLDADRVVELAKLIHRSRRILVVGVDLAASLAWFLAYGLTPLGFDADAPVGSAGNLQHRIDVLTSKDLLIAISFGRCLRETVESVIRARERGVHTFGITDGNTTPIAMHCEAYLLASTSSPSFTGSYVAPMALMNSIIVASAHIKPKRSLDMLGRTEDEYRSGERWYQEPLRHAKSGGDGEHKRDAGNPEPVGEKIATGCGRADTRSLMGRLLPRPQVRVLPGAFHINDLRTSRKSFSLFALSNRTLSAIATATARRTTCCPGRR